MNDKKKEPIQRIDEVQGTLYKKRKKHYYSTYLIRTKNKFSVEGS